MTNEKPKHWPWKTICLHGDSGVGKTTLSATAPHPFFLDSNQGLMSIEGREGFAHVRSTPVLSMRHLDRAYDNMTGTGKKDWTRFRTVVLDHMDDIQGITLDDLTELAAERDDRRQVDDPSQREYGIMGNRMRRYVRKLKRVPMHKIFICSTREDRETGKKRPNLIGALANQLPYYCDIIAFMRTAKDGRRILYLDDSEKWLAKCRAWWIPKKHVVTMDDTKFFTTLLRQIAAGPRSVTRRGEAR